MAYNTVLSRHAGSNTFTLTFRKIKEKEIQLLVSQVWWESESLPRILRQSGLHREMLVYACMLGGDESPIVMKFFVGGNIKNQCYYKV